MGSLSQHWPCLQKTGELGFTNVKALYLADNFGNDWVAKGSPVVTYLIDRDGIIRQRLEGETDLGELEGMVMKLLAGK